MKKTFQYLLSNHKFVLLVAWIIFVLGFCRLESNLQTPAPPEIIIRNLRLCMKQNNQQVTIPRLESFDKHFICGSVKSDVNPIRLTLIVEKDDGMYSVEYTDASQFVD